MSLIKNCTDNVLVIAKIIQLNCVFFSPQEIKRRQKDKDMLKAFSEFLEVCKNSSGIQCFHLMVEIASFMEEAVMKCVVMILQIKVSVNPFQKEEFAWVWAFSYNSC